MEMYFQIIFSLMFLFKVVEWDFFIYSFVY